jgi:hypothetical protein
MKLGKLILAFFTFAILLPAGAFAGKAAAFKGVYPIISRTEQTLDRPYFLLENDTLGVIWGKYSEDPLPANLEVYRNELAILAKFSNRSILFFGLERGAMVLPNYLSMEGGEGEKLEMRRRADGKMDMAVKEGRRITIYLLDTPSPVPNSN